MPTYRSGPADYSGISEGLSNLAKMFVPNDHAAAIMGQMALKQQEAARTEAGATALDALYPGLGAAARAGLSNPSQQFIGMEMLNRARGIPTGGSLTSLDPLLAIEKGYGGTQASQTQKERASLGELFIKDQGETTRSLLAPVASGATRFNPPSVASMYGVEPVQTGVVELGQGQRAVTPDNRVIEGPLKSFTLEEAKANEFSTMSPALRQAITFGSTPTPKIAGPDGPMFSTAVEAIGKPAYVEDKNKTQHLANYKKPDGGEGTARLDDTGTWIDSQTGEKLPQGIKTYTAQLSGGNEQTGLGASTQGNIEQSLVDVVNLEQTKNMLQDVITKNPMSQGIGGYLRGIGQDVVATSKEGAALLSKLKVQTKTDIGKGLVDPELVMQLSNYDPAIPQAKLLEMLLAGQLAKVIDPNGRISNDRMAQVTKAIGGGGWLSNAQRTQATLDTIQNIIDSKRAMFQKQAPVAAGIGVNNPGALKTTAPGVANPAAPVEPPQPNPQPPGSPGHPQPAADIGSMSLEQIRSLDPKGLSAEQLKAAADRFRQLSMPQAGSP